MSHETPLDLLNAGTKDSLLELPIEAKRFARLAGKVKNLVGIYRDDIAPVKRWLVRLGWHFRDDGVEAPGAFLSRQSDIPPEVHNAIRVEFDKMWSEGDRSQKTTTDERLTLACWMSRNVLAYRREGRLP